VAFRKKIYTSFNEIQTDLDEFFTGTIQGERIRASTAKAGLLWIHSPMDLNFAELIFMIERRAIEKRLKQLNRKAGCTRF
jgi:hypothetical protein